MQVHTGKTTHSVGLRPAVQTKWRCREGVKQLTRILIARVRTGCNWQ